MSGCARRRGGLLAAAPRVALLLALTAGLAAALPRAATAQEAAEAGSASLFRLRVSGILGPALPSAYTTPECRVGPTVGLAAGLSRGVHRYASVSVDVRYVRDVDWGGCAAALPAIPEPFTSRTVESEGPSMWATTVSVHLGPPVGSGPATVRAVGRAGLRTGLERRGLFALGAELLVGDDEGARLVLGVDRWFNDVTVIRTLRREEGGVVLEEDVSREVRPGDLTLAHIGLSWPLG